MIRTRVGYAGGCKTNPSYEDLGDHTEVVNINYNLNEVTFDELLTLFWSHHNPTIPSQDQYRSIIFYHNEEQKRVARISLQGAKEKTSAKIRTKIVPMTVCYNAEYYHQKYVLQHQHPWLVSALRIQTGDEFTQSHVCTKLNGFLGGYGKVEEIPKTGEESGLPEKMIDYIKLELKKSQSYIMKN